MQVFQNWIILSSKTQSLFSSLASLTVFKSVNSNYPYFAFFVQRTLGHILSLIKLNWYCCMTLLQSRCSLPWWKVLSSGILKATDNNMQATYLVAILPLIAGWMKYEVSSPDIVCRIKSGSSVPNTAGKLVRKKCCVQNHLQGLLCQNLTKA